MPVAESQGGQDLTTVFERWAGEPVLALAVSGGADSLALMLLAARWRQGLPAGPDLIVLSVDHGLRPEAAGEVVMVGAAAARLGLAFRPLVATGSAPVADIEAAAREQRYRLLFAAARDAGAAVLMTAHHADDQAETLLLRMARGSGVYGLAAMASETVRDGMRLARPFIAVERARLAAVVAEAGLEPAVDPHNADPRFARARLRALMPLLAAEGLDTARLTTTATNFRRAAAAIDDYADRLLARATVDATGAVRLDAAGFAAEPQETRLRVLARILRAAGGAEHGPRLESLMPLATLLADGDGQVAARTLAGVTVDRRKGTLRFQREAGRDGLPEIPIFGDFEGVWDGRFAVSIKAGPTVLDHGKLMVAPLGDAGRRAIGVCLPDGLPRAMEASPALYRGGALIAAPALGHDALPEHGIEARMRSIVAFRLAERISIDLK